MKVYTKTGDSGTTSLVGGKRTSKNDPRVEAYGTVDELMAHVAYLRDSMDSYTGELSEYRNDLVSILNTLMSVAAILATEAESEFHVPDIKPSDIEFLEKRIDYISAELRPIDKFTIPGGHPLVSLAHICRTICRRAERRAISAKDEYPISEPALKYLNRLSDYLYILGRRLSDEFNVKEILWISES